MPYLTNLRAVCGDIFEPVFCLIGCFLLVTLGVWAIMSTARRRRSQAAPALAIGAILVVAAFPGVVINEAWISCSLSGGYASQSAGSPPIAALRKASRRFRLS